MVPHSCLLTCQYEMPLSLVRGQNDSTDDINENLQLVKRRQSQYRTVEAFISARNSGNVCILRLRLYLYLISKTTDWSAPDLRLVSDLAGPSFSSSMAQSTCTWRTDK